MEMLEAGVPEKAVEAVTGKTLTSSEEEVRVYANACSGDFEAW